MGNGMECYGMLCECYGAGMSSNRPACYNHAFCDYISDQPRIAEILPRRSARSGREPTRIRAPARLAKELLRKCDRLPGRGVTPGRCVQSPA
jgi:hypothetical protein